MERRWCLVSCSYVHQDYQHSCRVHDMKYVPLNLLITANSHDSDSSWVNLPRALHFCAGLE